MAQRWTVSPDRKLYTFYFHPNARWSDGQPVTAQHFVDAWQRVLTPESGSEYAFFLYEIAGAEALYKGLHHDKADFSKVGVTIVSPRILQVHFFYR